MRILWRVIYGFFRFWYDFIIGDTWQLALGVAVILTAGAVLVHFQAISTKVLPILLAAAFMGLAVFTAALEWRRKAARRP